MTPTETKKLSEPEIRALVDEGGKLAKEVASLERKKSRLDAIKVALRELARGKDVTFAGDTYTAVVETKPDTICRVVAEEDVSWVVKTAGSLLTALFSLHPTKGNEKSFELNARRRLPKRYAESLIERLTVPATSWVRFN